MTLSPGQIPSSCEVARIQMPAVIPLVCRRSPVTHTLEGRVYNCEDKDLIPIRLYICTPCATKYRGGMWVLITPLTEYEF